MKRLGLATFALLTPAGVAEAGEFTANVSMVTDYVFRGVSSPTARPLSKAASIGCMTIFSMPARGRRTSPMA
ncbi:MAG: hypothetical protein M0D54_22000 [Hyphomonadaceae bacterium JAD_PAG50586_4]|nr:MAG: hypothetical protein M0D54_22000 [Hyphomonadaceae bacterium JAD_PAG50586_4]